MCNGQRLPIHLVGQDGLRIARQVNVNRSVEETIPTLGCRGEAPATGARGPKLSQADPGRQ